MLYCDNYLIHLPESKWSDTGSVPTLERMCANLASLESRAATGTMPIALREEYAEILLQTERHLCNMLMREHTFGSSRELPFDGAVARLFSEVAHSIPGTAPTPAIRRVKRMVQKTVPGAAPRILPGFIARILTFVDPSIFGFAEIMVEEDCFIPVPDCGVFRDSSCCSLMIAPGNATARGLSVLRTFRAQISNAQPRLAAPGHSPQLVEWFEACFSDAVERGYGVAYLSLPL